MVGANRILQTPGCEIVSSKPNTPCEVSVKDVCASSWATPAIAGAAALVRQYFVDGFYPTGSRNTLNSYNPSGALIKATLLNGTIAMTSSAGYPNYEQGWGLIRMDRVLYLPGSVRNLHVWDVRNIDGIDTGETHTYNVNVSTSSQPLKITLVFNDPPTANHSVPFPVVNNLDLKVVSPDGLQTFLGNVFSGGVSTSGGTADILNNVEMVIIPNPSPGTWIIQVIGTTVNVGNPGQGYALVVTSDLDGKKSTMPI